MLAAIIKNASDNMCTRHGEHARKPHNTVPSGYVIARESQTYINKVGQSTEEFHDKRFIFDALEKWFRRQDLDDFPWIEDFIIHQIGCR